MQLPDFLIDLDPSVFMTDNYLVLDFETTNKDFGSALDPENTLLMAVWWSPKFGWKEKVGNEYEMGDLLDDIASVDYIVAHNTKFELQWLARCGLDLHSVLPYCTMLGDYVIGGNRQFRVNLEACAKRYELGHKLNWVSKYLKDGVCLSELPQSSVLNYCYQDVKLTAEVFVRQRLILQERGLLGVAFTRNIFTPVLADIEAHGMHVDKEEVEKEYKLLMKEYMILEQEVEEFTGGLNPNSPKQKQQFFFKEMGFAIAVAENGRPFIGKPSKDWPKGAPSTGKEALAALIATNDKQRECVELFKKQGALHAKLSKTLKPLYACVTETPDQILYAQFNQARTKTHRLSSTGREYGCQFQNFPRQYKHLFSSRRPDWLIGEIDGAQLEFRVAAFMGQDIVAMDDIANDVDVHHLTASTLFREAFTEETDEKIKKELRNLSKADTFKPLYGGEKGTPQQEEYYRKFKEKYYGVAETQDEWVQTALNTKELVLPTGLITYYPYMRVTKTGYIDGHTKVRNLPVQYLATAEIIPVGVTYLWHYMHNSNLASYLINTVHDSAIAEVEPSEREIFAELGTKAFVDDTYHYLDVVYNIDFNVPLEAEAEFSRNWGG